MQKLKSNAHRAEVLNASQMGIEFEFWYSPDEHGRDSGIPAYKGLVNLADCGAMTD